MSKSAISKQVQMLLEQKGWNETELARFSGVQQSTVHRIASGETENPRTDSIIKIAKAFNVSYSFITGQTSTKNVESDSSVEYTKLSSAANKLVSTVYALADKNISEDDYLLICKLLNSLNEK